MSNQLWFEPFSKKILGAYANISSLVLNVFGQSTDVNGEHIFSSDFTTELLTTGADGFADELV